MLEDINYRCKRQGEGWLIEKVTDEQANEDFANAEADDIDIKFTIRKHSNGVMFMFYSADMTHQQINRQVAFMVKHPARL